MTTTSDATTTTSDGQAVDLPATPGDTTPGEAADGTRARVETRDRVVIRFAGDSGDGMQLVGDRFTAETAASGNDLSTFPDFPAEIRAPAGTVAGVSGFQLHFADTDILTPGDRPDVLVAMNPAALLANLADLPDGADLILNSDAFTPRALTRAGWAADPREDGSLDRLQVHPVPLTSLTATALEEIGQKSRRDAERSKNMFALGLASWLYSRPLETTERFLERKFASKPDALAANLTALRAGHAYGETTEVFAVRYEVAPAALPPGTYTNTIGNDALAKGIVAAGRLADLPVVLAAYPITPASDLLHALSRRKAYGVTTLQLEDEIAAVGAALGASFSGALGVTTTSGPGFVLKMETIGLAVMAELPLLVVDVQRGGPSTGLPTKVEQADLLLALHGRNSESPVAVVAARSPSDCFDAALEAARIAITYRTPVVLLSDAAIANGSEPWRLPDVESLPDLRVPFASADDFEDGFEPYRRDPETLARPWAVPGTAGLEHRVGGLEKADVTGAVSYDADNHQTMVDLRAAKIAGIQVPDLEIDDPTGDASTLVVGWGSTYGSNAAAVRRLRAEGRSVAQAHLRHLNPMPANTGDVLRRYERVVCPELNLGQLAMLLRAEFLVDVRSVTQVRGQPFKAEDLTRQIREVMA